MAQQRGLEDANKGAVWFLVASPVPTEVCADSVPAGGAAHSLLCNVETKKQEQHVSPTGASDILGKRKLKLEASDPEDGGCTPGTQRPAALQTHPSPSKRRRRFDGSSLAHLAQSFVQMMSASPDGTLDLNDVSKKIGVPKRRIYDVTNVLQGIQLIHKTSKNRIQWTGRHFDKQLNGTIKALMEEEQKLDTLIHSTRQHVYYMFENQKYAYLTYDDVRKMPTLKDQTVLVIKADVEVELQVPHPEESLQLHLSSKEGPIDVFMCSEDSAPAETSDKASNSAGGTSSVQSPASPCLLQTSVREKCNGSYGNGSSSSARAEPTQHSPPVAVTSPHTPTKDRHSPDTLTPPPTAPPPGEEILLTRVKDGGVTERFSSVAIDTLPQDAPLS